MSATQALVLAAHGSHHDPESAVPVHAHADRVRERGCFDVVRAAFWKEQPSLAEALTTVEAETTYVVPLMTSGGYFTDRVFPRELGLEDGRADRHAVRYTDPVGTHERVVDVVLDRVQSVLEEGIDESDVGLALVGHGTDRHRESATATAIQADRLRALDRFGAVGPLFLDQVPNVADLATAFEVDDIVVAPFFVADGGHVRRDVPDALGLAIDPDPFGGPTPVDGKRVWYTRAVGTAPALTDVILERAMEAGADIQRRATGRQPGHSEAEQAFLRWLEGAAKEPSGGPANPTHARTWGELLITVTADRGHRRYAARHRDDQGVPTGELDDLASPAAVRERTGTDEAGNHRPLRTAQTLPRGWVADELGRADVVQTIRAVYPTSIDHWYQARMGTLGVTGFESVIDRQAGRYRELDELDSETLAATIDACCGDCVRHREWPGEGELPATSAGNFPCPEPCSFLLEAARSFAETEPTKSPAEESTDPAVPPAAFDRAGNRYRVRFRRAVTHNEHDAEHPHLTP